MNWRKGIDDFVCLLGWAFIGVLLYFFLVSIIHGKEENMKNDKVCRMAVVQWADATIYTKASELFGEVLRTDRTLTTEGIAIGCLLERKNEWIIIHGFSGGKPDDFLVLPKGWIKKITYLEPKRNDKGGVHVDSTVGADSSTKH